MASWLIKGAGKEARFHIVFQIAHDELRNGLKGKLVIKSLRLELGDFELVVRLYVRVAAIDVVLVHERMISPLLRHYFALPRAWLQRNQLIS